MKPRITVITLGVRNFSMSLQFYKDGLGWPAKVHDDIAFFQAGNIILSIYPRDKLAEDATAKPEGNGFEGITLSQNVASEREVDETLEAMNRAGAKIVKKAQKAFLGRIQRLLCRSGWSFVGGCLQSFLEIR